MRGSLAWVASAGGGGLVERLEIYPGGIEGNDRRSFVPLK